MAGEFDDDPTARVPRPGVDPLIAFPKHATGTTGQIERPGDQTPWWFIPGLCAVVVLLFGLLIVVDDRRSGTLAEAPDTSIATDTSASASIDPTVASVDAGSVDAGVEPTVRLEAMPVSTVASTTTIDPRLDELPAPGFVRYQGSDREIRFRCEVHLPFDPADTATQTSSYFFFDSSGISQLIDRIDAPTGVTSQLHRGDFRFVDIVDIGDEGGFAATFDRDRRIEVLVNPGNQEDQDCNDRVVTNAPGQFTEPHARIVLDVCLAQDPEGRAVVGATSQGARFEILQAGGELGEIVFDTGDGEVYRTAAPAFLIRNEGILSASAVVSNGTDYLDITIDIGTSVGEANARPCSPSDRL